jgi:hypothetical protein
MKNSQKTQTPAWQMFLLAGCDEQAGNEAVIQQEMRQKCPVAVGKIVAISLFSEAPHFCLYLFKVE